VTSVVAALILVAALIALAGALAWTMRARHRISSTRSAFRCKVAISATGEAAGVRWPRRTAYAVWVHDVLVHFRGVTRTRTETFAVHFAEGAVTEAPRPVKGLGPSPVVLAMHLDDGRYALLAAERSSGALVVGPFLAALVTTGKTAS
jgi:hypothetical protein